MNVRTGVSGLAFATLSLFHPLAVRAQPSPAQLTGRVTVQGTTEAVLGATVSLEGTTIITRTDSLGRWTMRRVPAGPHTVIVRRIGYAFARVPITVPPTGSLTVDIALATNSLRLNQITVTAEPVSRAKGEIGTATVINQEAIKSQVASSLQGVLELLPGVAIQPPGLDAAAQISLRTLSQTGSGAGAIGAAGTLIILDGVPLSNNANLQTVGARGEVVPTASTAGGGIDLRRIPAAALERVEAIRGVPAVRWGDLTQGAIIVDTRAAETPPELTARFDPRTAEGNLVGGKGWQDDRQAITATFNFARTRAVQTLSGAGTLRGAAQVAHRLQLGVAPGTAGADARAPRLTLDTRLDWWQLKYDSPERPEIEIGRSSYQNDNGFRLGERARLALAGGTLEWTAAVDIQNQSTRETKRLGRATQPFTDRTTEGRNIGTFIDGLYIGAYELGGAPRLLYSRLEWERARTSNAGPFTLSHLRAGVELRREWNGGTGYQFAADKPPQSNTLTGVNGYDRPRSFADISPVASTAAYADVRLSAQRGTMTAELQPGIRADVLHSGSWWVSGSRSAVLQPRLTARVAPAPWLRFNAGVGVVAKTPTVAQLSPAPQYFDVVNVNRYTPNPAERLAVVTTFIRDPVNKDLGYSRGTKREVGVELDGGARRGMIGLTWFNDVVSGAVTVRRDPFMLLRDRYELVDTAQGTGHPGRIIDPPIGADTIPIFLDRYVNGGHLDSRGVEFTVAFPDIPRLRTRLEVSGATIDSRFSTTDRDFGTIVTVNNFEIDTNVTRIPYFEGASNRAKRTIITWRLVHHQPQLGFVVTATVQQLRGDVREVTGRTDSLAFSGYITRAGVMVPVAESDKLKAEYADLRRKSAGTTRTKFSQPDDWVMTLQVAKSLGRSGRLSFYVYNVLDKLATFGAGGAVRALPASRFGAELTLPTADLFGRGRDR